MSKLIDESIRLAGRQVEIIRSSGNLSTYMWAYSTGYLAGKRKQEPVFQHEAGAMFPSNSDIVAGDLVYDYTNYFLVVSLSQDIHYGEAYGFRAMLYKCNAIVSIMGFNNATNHHDTLVQAGVHCLITQVQAMAWDEDGAQYVYWEAEDQYLNPATTQPVAVGTLTDFRIQAKRIA